MEALAFWIGLSIVALGVIGAVSPEHLISAIRYLVTPVGLYAVAAFRITTGFILVRVAPASRTPRLLGVIGAITFISGLITPFIGPERARAIFDWWSRPPGLMRAWAAVAIIFGVFVAYTVSPSRRRTVLGA
jgi:hypothetical protein